jgi:hypothetical protein
LTGPGRDVCPLEDSSLELIRSLHIENRSARGSCHNRAAVSCESQSENKTSHPSKESEQVISRDMVHEIQQHQGGGLEYWCGITGQAQDNWSRRRGRKLHKSARFHRVLDPPECQKVATQSQQRLEKDVELVERYPLWYTSVRCRDN